MKLRILSPAHNDIVDAARYLEDQAGLGAEFLELVYQQIDAIEAAPYSCPLWELNTINAEIRRVILRRFPYVIDFQLVQDEVVILTVCHGRRDAGEWLKRVRLIDE